MTRCFILWLQAPAVGLVLVLAATTAWAGSDLTHRVAQGESASSIASRYYADYELAALLLGYNGKSGTVIRVGESLKIPVCDEHVVRAGDTWSALAQRYLGRTDGWPAVAVLNGVLPEQPLRVGQRLVFPVVLEHALRPGESLAVLAQRFYGDTKRGEVLRQFNSIDDPRRLSVGQAVGIPLVVFRASSKPEPEPKKVAAAPSAPTPLPRRFTSELRSAALALAEGEFDSAADQIGGLRVEVARTGTPEEQVELWRLLALVSVAREDGERACRAYQALVDVQGDWTPDPDLVSPKVRDAFARCL
jgi:LysM repeat protein